MSHKPKPPLQNRSALGEIMLCSWAFIFLICVLMLNLSYT